MVAEQNAASNILVPKVELPGEKQLERACNVFSGRKLSKKILRVHDPGL